MRVSCCLLSPVFAIASGYPDRNDAARLATDPIHKMLADRDPIDGDALASQPTLSRFENPVDRKALFRMGEAQANRGAGGIDGKSMETFAEQSCERLDRLHAELRADDYRPQPVRQVPIPKAGKPGEYRTLGIPTIYDRVCQQAVLNRLEPIFEPVFDEANFGYRRGRSTKDALRKVWKEIEAGNERTGASCGSSRNG